MPSIHQVARRWLEREDFGHGASGVVETFEQQQRHVAMSHERLRGERDFGRQRERAF